MLCFGCWFRKQYPKLVHSAGSIPRPSPIDEFLREVLEENDNFAQNWDDVLLQKEKIQQKVPNVVRKKKNFYVKTSRLDINLSELKKPTEQ